MAVGRFPVKFHGHLEWRAVQICNQDHPDALQRPQAFSVTQPQLLSKGRNKSVGKQNAQERALHRLDDKCPHFRRWTVCGRQGVDDAEHGGHDTKRRQGIPLPAHRNSSLIGLEEVGSRPLLPPLLTGHLEFRSAITQSAGFMVLIAAWFTPAGARWPASIILGLTAMRKTVWLSSGVMKTRHPRSAVYNLSCRKTDAGKVFRSRSSFPVILAVVSF